MANWYVSSVNYFATPQWAASTPYTIGQFVRSLATPAQPFQYFVYRCTTAGTTGATEPSWPYTNNGTVTNGTAIFTNVSGQQTYGWAAAIGTLYSITNSGYVRAALGDRIYIGSDHSETHAGSGWSLGPSGWGSVNIVSINRAGSVPPVEADFLPGATINGTAGTFIFDATCNHFYQGIKFTLSSTTTYFNSGSNKGYYFKDCAFSWVNAALAVITGNNPSKVTFDNTTIQYAHIGSIIRSSGYTLDFTWLNTPNAIKGAIIPTNLFTASAGAAGVFTLRGVDLSVLTTTILQIGSTGFSKILLDSCKIAPTVVRYSGLGNAAGEIIELVNCFDGTTILNERIRAAGALTVDRATFGNTLDSLGAYSFKLVSSVRSDRFVEALDTFFFDVENLSIGSVRTATVEIISSLTLNDDDVYMSLEYLGTAGSTLATYVSSKPHTLATPAALTLSSASWTNPPATPVKQRVNVSFTPQTVGRVRARIHLGRPSTTIWVNPQLVLS